MTSGGERLTYNSYLKVPQLLELQNFESSPAAHDELLFIVIHQAYELWFKLILFELDQVAEEIEKNEIYEAGRLLQRVLQIEKLLVQQIHVLETMTPRDFLRFRSALNPASGFQSIQFREVEFLTGIRDTSVMAHIDQTDQDHRRLLARLAEPSLRTRFYRLLEREGFEVVVPEEGEVLEGERLEKNLAALLPLYRHPEKRFHLYTLAESLVEHDQNILLWRFHHVRVVERLLGTKPGTGGSSGVAYLSSTLEKRAYPQLWQVRGLLSDDEIYGAS
ncbi:tryptophan 2,3-dioxygenase [Lujinxingia litoralis]|uniref:Tryptophan 2,3-dioxygenase n=2 Tax=Lujinxingia litoralis TaxID=2211119 RepID=A0A328CCA0_9DELT|nr:tryptophan 2,3-dioxygenase [Lujinxingia litoralis]